MGLAHTLNEQVFSRIHGSKLVYNTCWEDPRCDRNLLNLNEKSRVVMLTSAGCNALDYLLDAPASIDCVDLNPRQNALLELKCALFDTADHAALFELFGRGGSPRARQILAEAGRSRLLATASRAFWRRHLHYFSQRGLRPSFYWRGSSGAVAWLVRKWLQSQPEALRLTRRLLAAENVAEQWIWHEQWEPKFFNPLIQWLVQQHFVQSMLGVPKSQQHLAAERYPDGLAGYVRHCLRQVFAQLPLADNYFWKVYFQGHYTPDCCPNYLREAHFDTLRARVGRIAAHTDSLSGFLRKNPGAYTHFVLLDHQDWLAAHLRPALEEEWHLILDNAAPGAKVLLRSAAFELDFLPDFVKKRVRFDREAAAREHARDRVGTYASTWVGEI